MNKDIRNHFKVVDSMCAGSGIMIYGGTGYDGVVFSINDVRTEGVAETGGTTLVIDFVLLDSAGYKGEKFDDDIKHLVGQIVTAIVEDGVAEMDKKENPNSEPTKQHIYQSDDNSESIS